MGLGIIKIYKGVNQEWQVIVVVGLLSLFFHC